jgi:RNA polymerase sigma-70 factor, ECF subfamily
MPSAVEKVYDSSLELDLIHRAKKGDENAFRALYDAHHGRVFVTVKRVLSNNEDAAQWVANVAMTQVWKFLRNFKENSKFSTWVTRIAINEARMYLRSQKRRQREVSLDSMLTDFLPQAASKHGQTDATSVTQKWLSTRDLELEGIPDRQVLERAFKKVPVQFREVLRLRFWEGCSMEEIQAKISAKEPEPVSIPAVKSRILRGRAILMKQVEKIS